MKLKKRFIAAALLTFCAPLIDADAWLFALQNKNNARPSQTESKPVSNPVDLSTELRELTKEITKLSDIQRRLLDTMILQIEQERTDKVEERLLNLENRLDALKSQETQLEARLRNIEPEILARNIVNRQEGERLVRADLQTQLELVRAEIFKLEPKVQKIRLLSDNAKERLEKVRTRIEQDELKQELDKKAPNLEEEPKDKDKAEDN